MENLWGILTSIEEFSVIWGKIDELTILSRNWRQSCCQSGMISRKYSLDLIILFKFSLRIHNYTWFGGKWTNKNKTRPIIINGKMCSNWRHLFSHRIKCFRIISMENSELLIKIYFRILLCNFIIFFLLFIILFITTRNIK